MEKNDRINGRVVLRVHTTPDFLNANQHTQFLDCKACALCLDRRKTRVRAYPSLGGGSRRWLGSLRQAPAWPHPSCCGLTWGAFHLSIPQRSESATTKTTTTQLMPNHISVEIKVCPKGDRGDFIYEGTWHLPKNQAMMSTESCTESYHRTGFPSKPVYHAKKKIRGIKETVSHPPHRNSLLIFQIHLNQTSRVFRI